MMRGMQRLLVRADDLGSFSGVAPAVRHARRHGIVRNASFMAVTTWFEAAARTFADDPTICCGIHLTICCEWPNARWKPVLPAARVPCLVDDQGFLLPDPGKIHERGVVVEQILAECDAQVERARGLGLDLRYADTHMGWDWIHPADGPRLATLLPAWAHRHGIRWYAEAPLSRLARGNGATLDARLLDSLGRSGPGTYLVVTHPTWPSQAAATAHERRQDREIQSERIADAEFLADPALAQTLAERGVALTRYDDIF